MVLDDVGVDDPFPWREPVKEIVNVEGGRQIEPRRVSLEEARASGHVVAAERTKTLRGERGEERENN